MCIFWDGEYESICEIIVGEEKRRLGSGVRGMRRSSVSHVVYVCTVYMNFVHRELS